MPIQLDKILADIAEEKVLHPNYPPAGKKEIDDAWARVGKNNKLSVHEARSIFKVLQKKYEQEKTKRTPSWKLFDLMEQIHQPIQEEDPKQDDDGMVSMEEDEEYEMLEVQEEDESTAAQGKGTAATSDGESPSKSIKSSGSNETTPEKEEKPLIKPQAKLSAANQSKSSSPAAEEKKVLNSLAHSSRPSSNTTSNSTPTSNASAAATVAALHKKGITMKKTSSSATAGNTYSGTTRVGQSTSNSGQQKNSTIRVAGQVLGVGESIPLPESIKRKLVETQPGSQPAKKPNNNHSITTASSAQTSTTNVRSTSTGSSANPSASLQESSLAFNESTINIKQEPNDDANQPTGINLITITGNPRVELTNGGGGPSSSTAATVASTSTNGYSPRLEEIDFRNDIIFDSGNGAINGAVGGAVNHPNHTNATGGIINLGNFDNSLPPTFFKNLCNSSRHEALGLYVANVMNRLRPRSAQKLELGILRAIIDVQSDELEQ
ncbi:mucin-21 [Bactrocera oleae]|uniref:mucin-21 n=1 Tax=Bactrocera oleae TaxID=104688 RepID=UPI00387E75B6